VCSSDLEAFVPATVVFVVVAAVGMDRHRVTLSAIWISTVLAAVAILRARDRSIEFLSRPNAYGYRPALTLLRLSLSGVILAGAIGIGASMAGPLLPGANDEAWLTTRQNADGRVLEPLVDVRRRLSNPTDQVLFTVTADRSAYWRLTSLPLFDGATWTIPNSVLNDAGGALAPLPDTTRAGLDIASNVQRLSISNLAGTLLPVSYEPVQLRAASRSLFYELQSGSVVVGGDGLVSKDTYELVSSNAAPRPELLGLASASNPPSLASLDTTYLEVPDNDEIRQLRGIVSDIVDIADTPYAIALDLQSYFRDTFTYSLDVPNELDGAATLAFLERRTGYCEQFSSTFALFARLANIPSRVAVGFTPGEVVSEINGRSVFEVRSQHAHAWPELWFDDIGWVLFEPTPGRGAPNAGYTNVPEEQDESTPIPSPENSTTTTTAAPLPNDDPTIETTVPINANDEANTSSGGSQSLLTTWRWPLLIVLAFALWVVVIPHIVRSFMSRRMTGTLLDPWRQVVAFYEFQRGPFNSSLSPSEIAAVATSRLWDDDPFIVELSQAITEVLYSGRVMDPHELERWTTQTNRYLAERTSRLSRGARMKIRLSPWVIARLTGAHVAPSERIQ
jgi:transglutaminase-like putative cysteine protease